MVKPEDVLVETVVKAVEEKAPEITKVVQQVEEALATKSCSCWVFGWNIVANKSPAAVSNTDSKE
jgi:hypothetical protein